MIDFILTIRYYIFSNAMVQYNYTTGGFMDAEMFLCDCLFKLGLNAYAQMVSGSDTKMLRFYALIVIEHGKRSWSFVKCSEIINKLKILKLV